MVKYGFIILLCVLSGILVYTFIDSGRKKAAHKRIVEQLETEILDLTGNNTEFAKQNTELERKLNESDERFRSLEKRYQSVVEDLRRSQDISNQLSEDSEILRTENEGAGEDIRELEKLLEEFLVD